MTAKPSQLQYPAKYSIMGAPRLKSKRESFRALIEFIFTFENKKGEVLDSWIAFHDELSFPPREFYEIIEQQLTARRVPGLEISREEFCEGGLLSEKRIYLRLFRERFALYTCAAPFGSGSFFSCRAVYVPALVRLWHILAALSFLALVGGLLVKPLGIVFAAIAVVTLLFALAAVFRNAAGAAVSDVDSFLLKIPVLSTIYEGWFRADSFYREDTRTIYLQAIPKLIKEIAEEVTASKGAKLVQQYKFSPVLDDFYKPVPPTK